MVEISGRYRDSLCAFALAVLGFIGLVAAFAVYAPELAFHTMQRVVGEIMGIAVLALLGWAYWLFYGRRKYHGWELHVENLDGSTNKDVVPAAVVEMWIGAKFSGFGPHGWRDIVETLDRRSNGCPNIEIDAWTASKRKALRVDFKRKIVYVSYLLMKETSPEELPTNGVREDVVLPA